MPINPKDVTWIKEPELGFWEATFLPAIAKGLKTTLGPHHAVQAGDAAVSRSRSRICRSIIAACIG